MEAPWDLGLLLYLVLCIRDSNGNLINGGFGNGFASAEDIPFLHFFTPFSLARGAGRSPLAASPAFHSFTQVTIVRVSPGI
ncbi:hypothetical protein FPV67DRAFT_177809 [Lyophyllum atratum]|nr:hypothetical protein FPV67DRAFT_177809 [Lyophyllum atratum]